MAQQIVIVDDITGESGAQTRRIRIDGVEYYIDLTDSSFTKLKDALRPFLESARVVRTNQRTNDAARGTPVRRTTRIPSPSATIRAWASAHGIECPARGRIPTAVTEAYEKAQTVYK